MWNLERQAVADGEMTGEAQACHGGVELHELQPDNCIGYVYLYVSPSLLRDAIHELTHAAVHYVREIVHGNLAEPNNGEYASAAEEKLCRSMENYLLEFAVHLARFENAPRPKVPAGYSAEELELDNPHNAWAREAA